MLDRRRPPVPVGAPGELYLGGAAAGPRLPRPTRSHRRPFVADPLARRGAGSTAPATAYGGAPTGALEYLGRTDDQVKVRGVRIEPGEVEPPLNAHPDVTACAVAARTGPGGTARLIAWVVTEHRPVSTAVLRAFLADRLPGALIPDLVVPVTALPIGTTGKLDRRALPDPSVTSPAPPRPPIGRTAVVLAAIWAGLLELDTVNADDHFFDLGGHSLLAARLTSHLLADLGVDLPLRTVFDTPVLSDLALSIDQHPEWASAEAIPVAPRRDPIPMSFAQQRLWSLAQLGTVGSAYTTPMALRFTGHLDAAALRAALEDLVTRHEILRTTLDARHGTPRQVVHQPGPVNLPTVDVSTSADPPTAARQSATALAELPFDLATDPPLRATLIQLGTDDHVLALSVHHTAFDQWSVDLLWHELSAAYASYTAGTTATPATPAIQYADWAAWQRQRLADARMERLLSYWRSTLADLPTLELPTDRPRPPVYDPAGGLVEFTVPDEIAAQLRAAGRAHGSTLFMTILAAFQVLLSRYTGQTDITVGTSVSARTRPETQALIGLFLNTLVLRADLGGNPTVGELLERTRSATIGALTHQDLPFERLVADLAPERDRTRHPLFQVMFDLVEEQPTADDFAQLTCRRLALPHTTTRFDLALTMTATPEHLHGGIEFSRALFDEPTIRRLTEHLIALFSALPGDPQRRIDALPMLSAAEIQSLHRWGVNPPSRPASPVPQRIVRVAAERPDAVAVIDPRARLTYAELVAAAGHLAARLHSFGVGPDSIVGVFVDQDANLPVTVLGIWLAGAAYLPLDPDAPADRLSYLLRDAGALIVVTTHHLVDTLPAGVAVPLILDEPAESMPPVPWHPPETHPEGLAYVIYTSGSTGAPKGVAVRHAGLAALADAQHELFDVGSADRVLQFATPVFDASVWELVMALTAGATSVITPPPMRQDPLLLLDYLAAHDVSVATLPPTLLAVLDHEALEGRIRTLIAAGERLPADVAARWVPGRRLVNAYGPTETTVCATAGPVPGRTAQPGIGTPIPAARCHVLDPAGHRTPTGVPGELLVGGPLLARGYLGRPDLTAERFVADPFSTDGSRLYRTGDLVTWTADADLRYLGRVDDQVKIRGFRVEPAEIEAALAHHPDVAAAAVAMRTDRLGHPRLIAWVTPAQPPRAPDPDQVRRHLTQRLPAHLVPAQIAIIPALPLTPSGKIDRHRLPDPAASPTTNRTRPPTAAESALAEAMAEVLSVATVEAEDNFFEIGGDSITAIQFVAAARTRGWQVSAAQVFELPTVAAMAAVADRTRADLPSPVTGEFPLAGLEPAAIEAVLNRIGQPVQDLYPLSPLQEGMCFHTLLAPDAAVYHEQTLIELRGPLDPTILRRAATALAERHPVLRTRFCFDGVRRPLQAVLPTIEPDVTTEQAMPAEQLLAYDLAKGFDLTRAPLWRLTVTPFAPDSHQLLFAHHHALLDGWSTPLLLDEMLALYRSLARTGHPPALPDAAPYRHYIGYLNTLDARSADEYWAAQLGTLTAATPLPAAQPRPHSGYAERHTPLEPTTSDRLHAFVRQHHLTVHTMVAAAWSLLLARHSGQHEVTFGSTVSGRSAPVAGIERMVGLLINTVPVRVTVPGDAAVGQWLRELHRQLGEQVPFHHTPLTAVRAVTGVPAGEDLFHTLIVVENYPHPSNPSPDGELEVCGQRAVEHDNYPLTLVVSTGQPFEIGLSYDRAWYDESTVETLLEQLRTLLDALITDPDVPLAAINLGGGGQSATAPAGRVSQTAPPIPGTTLRPTDDHLLPLLAELWTDLLDLDTVGADDNFFTVGGDSISAILLVARARERGIELTPRQVFTHPTLHALAAAATVSARPTPTPTLSRAVPLTPIQHWFFAQERADHNHYSQTQVIDLPAGTSAAHTRTALHAIRRHHDALRLRYQPGASHALIDPAAEPADDYDPLLVLDEADQADQQTMTRLAALPTGLDVRNGVLMRAAYLVGQPNRLVWTAHHLAVDQISWHILRADLHTALTQLAGGAPIHLAPVPLSWAQWAATLAEHRQDGTFDDEATIWNDPRRRRARPIPLDDASIANRLERAHVCAATLDADRTHTWLRRTNQAHRTRPHELLYAAIAAAVADWTGSTEVLLDIEGHGREALDGADLSRTVGWFTTLTPAHLSVTAPDVAGLVRAVKERLRTLPRGGLGHGVLQWLGEQRSDASAGPVEADRPRPDVAVNYLGDLGTTRVGPESRPAVGPAQDMRGVRTHEIELNTFVQDGQLHVEVTYAAGRHSRTSIEQFTRRILDTLVDLATHCAEQPPGGATPSDFPLAGLDQVALDQVLATTDGHVSDLYPLTPLQQGMCFHTLLNPRSGAYHEQTVQQLSGPFEPDAFRLAVNELVRRHPILRTQFHLTDLPQPLQSIRTELDIEVPLVDAADAPDATIDRLLNEDRARGFDLAHAPLWRATLVRHTDTEHYLLLSHHHALLDGWSLPVLLHELFSLYEAHHSGRSLPRASNHPFRDYVAYVAGLDRTAASDHWTAALGDVTAATPLPLATPNAARGYADVRATLPAALHRQLHAFCRRRGLTINTVVHAAWALVLARYAGHDDVIFGTTVSGRTAPVPGIDTMVGLLINAVPTRIRLPATAPVGSWLTDVQRLLHDQQPYHHTALTDIHAATAMAGDEPLFHTLLIFENYPTRILTGDSTDAGATSALQTCHVRSVEQDDYPLTVVVLPDDPLTLLLAYDRAFYDHDVAATLAKQLVHALTELTDDEARHLGELALPDTGGHGHLANWSGAVTAPPVGTVLDAIAARCAEAPDAPALIAGARQLTYRQLDARANRLARHLLRHGAGAETVIAVRAAPSCDLVCALLAIWRAGATYLPVDPNDPPGRAAALLAEAAVPLVVTDRALPDELGTWAAVQLDNPAIDDGDATPPPTVAHPSQAAYLMYTSGSTGRPKGVVVSHRNLANLAAGQQHRFGLTAADRLTQFLPIGFDVAISEIVAALTVGATLCIVDEHLRTAPDQLAQFLRNARITFAQLPPAVLAPMPDQQLPDLRLLLTGGEAFSPPWSTAGAATDASSTPTDRPKARSPAPSPYSSRTSPARSRSAHRCQT